MPQTSQQRTPKDERNYILKIDLEEVTDPVVSRTLSVPPTTTFHKLHYAIQIAFGWDNAHLYHFQVISLPALNTPNASKRRRLAPPRVLLQLDGPGLDNDIWFDDEERVPNKDVEQTRLCDVLELAKYRNKFIQYLYDFGDSWEHSVTLIGRAEEGASANAISVLSGEGGSVAEDCGGVDGWENLKESLKRKQKGEMSKEETEYVEHYESFVCDGDLDPWNWNMDDVNQRLAEIDEEMRVDKDCYHSGSNYHSDSN